MTAGRTVGGLLLQDLLLAPPPRTGKPYKWLQEPHLDHSREGRQGRSIRGNFLDFIRIKTLRRGECLEWNKAAELRLSRLA